MGVLRALADDQQFELLARTLVGRAPHCELRLSSPRVSGEHAAITWTSTGWEIRDLGSRNGTFVDGRRLEIGDRVRAGAACRVAFGDPAALFEWQQIGPPPATASASDGRILRASGGVLSLPSDEDPQVVIFWQGGRWLCEDDAGRRAAGPLLTVDGEVWTLALPHVLATTVQAGVQLDEIALELRLSRDEEHVETVARWRGVERPLPARAHHYLLVVLARLRLADEDAGWVHTDRLTRMLALDRRTVNVQIFRARQEFGALGVVDAADLIERRPGGFVRIGVQRLTVRSDADA